MSKRSGLLRSILRLHKFASSGKKQKEGVPLKGTRSLVGAVKRARIAYSGFRKRRLYR